MSIDVHQQLLNWSCGFPPNTYSASDNFYLGQLSIPNGFSTDSAWKVAVACTITECSLVVNNRGTLGSNESSTAYIRIAGADTTISTAVKTDAAGPVVYALTSQSLAVAAGDELVFRFATAASWSTQPTNLIITVNAIATVP
jgi:hypothetical protein